MWKEFGGNYPSIAEFGRSLGPANGFSDAHIAKYRIADAKFKGSMDEITEERSRRRDLGTESKAPYLAQERWPNLERWKGIWIERYRETYKRLEACATVGKTLAEVERELDDDPLFMAGYDEVNREVVAAIEDAQVSLSAQGKGGAAAASILEVQSERFSKMRARQNFKTNGADEGSLTSYSAAEARSAARELFRRTLQPSVTDETRRDADASGDSLPDAADATVEEPARPALAAS